MLNYIQFVVALKTKVPVQKRILPTIFDYSVLNISGSV